MIGRRVVVGLSLLCALVFCALGAQGASAAGTTAFTCVKVTKGAQFKDAHCDETQAGGEGFAHEEIPVNKTTEVTGSNQKTANKTTEHTIAIFHSIKAGVEITITCTKVHSEGWIENTEVGGVMHVGGAGVIRYSECKVSKPVNKEGKETCKVKEPIEASVKSKTWEKGEEMGVEFSSKEAGKPFVELTLENNGALVCPLKGTFPIEGSVIGTPGNSPTGKGATLHFTATVGEEKEFKEGKVPAGMQKLTFGGSPSLLTQTETVEMKEEIPTTGKAITLTTK